MKLDKDDIARRLSERGALLPCSRCGNNNFSILDGYTKFFINNDIERMGDLDLGGPAVPVIMVACNKCGAVTLHAMGAIGLLDKKEEIKK